MSLSVVILAAGQGSRMGSSAPKVLRHVAGRPMLGWILKTLKSIQAAQVMVVVGAGSTVVQEYVCSIDPNIRCIEQTQPLGTGHAVSEACQQIDSSHQVLVLLGDVPGVQTADLKQLIEKTGDGFGLLTTTVIQPDGLGRVVRDSSGAISGVVEHSDASLTERNIREINTGVLLAPAAFLQTALPRLKHDNMQGEYYLLDVLPFWLSQHGSVAVWHAQGGDRLCGVNTPLELSKMSRVLQRRQAEAWLQQGVDVQDPARVDIRGEVTVEPGAFIDINVVFSGTVSIATGAHIGPGCCLHNVSVGRDARVHAYSVCEDSDIAPQAQVGPHAVVRQSSIGAQAQVGCFVELKRSQLGESVKAKHLAYLGDARIASNVNIGAGVITCNYDGANKHLTHIETGAFVGAGVQLIAPIKVESQAFVAAGSTLRTDAPANCLTIVAMKPKYLKHWKRPQKHTASADCEVRT